MKNILIDVAVEPAFLNRLEGVAGISLEVIPENTAPHEEPKELLSGKQVLFCHLPPRNIDDMRELEWIQLASSGYTQAIGLGLAARGVRVCNASGVFDTAIAEWNVAMMINLLRDMRTMIRHQEAGVWDRSARFQKELRGSVAGIWGYGGIGRETARLLKAHGVKVHVMTRGGVRPRNRQFVLPNVGDPEGILPDRVFVKGQEAEFLEGLDFLILSMPLSDHTRGIIGERELRLLPSHAYLLNPARGPLVQEAALLHALREGWIAGAALDTHYVYPMPADHPLWSFPNVIMTPHISGSVGNPYFLSRVWELFVGNVERWRAGMPLLNEIAAAELDNPARN
ncbi:D-2-hydroxyacid dehydrogenase [Paenibacillus sp. HJGM_3]|uniref:D-2-hydroxyacid dehydrogenase n=1 Tax=Paenibacillus sp. HJGM_3 TaxID=3379816 RepID=UPI00385A0239